MCINKISINVDIVVFFELLEISEAAEYNFKNSNKPKNPIEDHVLGILIWNMQT